MNKNQLAAALKAVPGARGSISPQSSGMGRISPVQSEMYYNNPYKGNYGPFMPRPADVFSAGAFSPMPPIQPVPVDEPPAGGEYPNPRWWQYPVGWNLPTQPGSEGLKLASFDQLKMLSERYSIARACISLRIDEIRGLGWEIGLTKEAAKAYQGDRHENKRAGEAIAELRRWFSHPDPEYFAFSDFLAAALEEIFVYDALALVLQPTYGEKFGMGGRGLLGSKLKWMRLVSGPTIRPLIDLHGGHPRGPAPAYQQFLYGVPRSDTITMARGDDIAYAGMEDSYFNTFDQNIMIYRPLVPRRETPYGFPPVEQALLPIVSGLQKQQFQLDYFTEGTMPAVYISLGDPSATATQIREFQDALNGIAGDPAFHHKVIVLPGGAKVEPQRPVDLSDAFDQLIMEQVTMMFDVQPMELGIIPNIGGGQQGPSASSIRFASQEARDIKTRKSTKPLLQFLCEIFDYIIQDVCGQKDLRFQFEGLADDEDKQAITELGVEQVQNAISSIDEVRDRLDMAPWGLPETSEPVVFTASGPVPLRMAQQLLMSQMQGGQQGGQSSSNNRTQSGNSGQKNPSPTIRRGGQTRPNGSHPAPVVQGNRQGEGRTKPRESLTPAHSAAQGAIQSPTPRTGGSPNRSSTAGSRKKAITAELESLRRHLRKDRSAIFTWEPRHIDGMLLAKMADDINNGVLIDRVIDKALVMFDFDNGAIDAVFEVTTAPDVNPVHTVKSTAEWPGWEHDLGLVGQYKRQIGEAFKEADQRGSVLRQKAANGEMYVSGQTLRGLIADEVHELLMDALTPLWTDGWHLGYEAGKSLSNGVEPDFTQTHQSQSLEDFLNTQGEHWLDEISKVGLKNISSRPELISRTEVARAINAGAIQAYRTNGIGYKSLALSPDDTCDICKSAADQGVIPLDSIWPGGDIGGPFHPACRCVPVPANIQIIPPMAHLSKSDDPSMVSFILFCSQNKNGKDVFLLQKRKDDTWGLPGGTSHDGEDPWSTAQRESQEEIGDLPACAPKAQLTMNDGERVIHIYVCKVSAFTPKMNGATPEETQGWGWFTKKEMKKLPLQPHFKEQWENLKWDDLSKAIASTEMGEMMEVDPEYRESDLFPAGARWPYPRRSDGAEDPHYGTAEIPEPPAWNNDMWDGPAHPVDGPDDTDQYPKERAAPSKNGKKPNQGGRRYPDTSNGNPGPVAQSMGSRTGVPPSGKALGAPRPATGSVPAQAPKPMAPEAEQAQAPVDPSQFVATEEDGEIAYYPKPKTKNQDADLANPNKPGGAADYSDPNPVDAEHVYVQMAKNFPPEAIQWVKRAKWTGPVNIPWNRIDTDDIESWAASHQPDHVKNFERLITAHEGHVAPSIIVQEPNDGKAFIVDGHHRALAHKNLGQPVLSYLGNIDPKDRKAAEETHSSQIHSGRDPRNV